MSFIPPSISGARQAMSTGHDPVQNIEDCATQIGHLEAKRDGLRNSNLPHSAKHKKMRLIWLDAMKIEKSVMDNMNQIAKVQAINPVRKAGATAMVEKLQKLKADMVTRIDQQFEYKALMAKLDAPLPAIEVGTDSATSQVAAQDIPPAKGKSKKNKKRKR